MRQDQDVRRHVLCTSRRAGVTRDSLIGEEVGDRGRSKHHTLARPNVVVELRPVHRSKYADGLARGSRECRSWGGSIRRHGALARRMPPYMISPCTAGDHCDPKGRFDRASIGLRRAKLMCARSKMAAGEECRARGAARGRHDADGFPFALTSAATLG